MELRHIRLKDVSHDQLEGMSAHNAIARWNEERERMPIEIDDAELFRLGKSLEEDDNPLTDHAIEKVEAASEQVQETLRVQYAKRMKLLNEKSLLMAETLKRCASEQATARKIEKTKAKMNVKDQAALDRVKATAKRNARRMENNRRELTYWDSMHSTMEMRRTHLRRLMGCDAATADKYENELASKMLWAKRGRTFSTDIEREKRLRNGETAPYTVTDGLLIQWVDINDIATPIEEDGYIGDGGYMAGYLALMEQMPEIIPLIRRGMSVDEILNDGSLRAKASQMISREDPITLSEIQSTLFDERYQVLDVENQRRVVVARLFGARLVPAKTETVLRDV